MNVLASLRENISHFRQEKEEKKIEKVRERERLSDRVEMLQSELREIKDLLARFSLSKDQESET